MIDFEHLDRKKADLKAAFMNSKPTRYFILDGFLKDGYVKQLADGYAEVMARAGKDPLLPKKHRHVLKKIGVHRQEMMNDIHRRFFEEIQQPRLLEILQEITGIERIYPDNDLEGGGLHEIYRGGYLNVHTDFNFHPKTNQHRRLNILFYLNEDWKDEWEGHLELWNEDVTKMVTRFAPLANRMAIFETSETSFHGHPTPLNVPESVTRKSLATYYYADWPEGLQRRERTNYKLVPWQIEKVQKQIDQMKASGADDQKIMEILKAEYQEADLKRQLRDYYQQQTLNKAS